MVGTGCAVGTFQQNSNGCIYGDCQEGQGVKRDNQGLYVGPFSQGKLQGTGTYRSSHEELRYVGGWKKGQWDGRGTVFVKNGSIEGEWRGGKAERITYRGTDGSFSGNLSLSRLPVQGLLKWPNGAQYHGDFGCFQSVCGLPQGQGEYQSSTGQTISGQFATEIVDFLYMSFYRGKVITEHGVKSYTLKVEKNGSPITFQFKDFD